MIDPHNEYAAALGERALRLDPSNLELPYWLLTFEEIATVLTSGSDGRGYAEGAILRDAILRAKLLYLGAAADTAHITVDTPVPYRLADLARVIEDGMGTLNKPEGAAAYRHLLSRLASVREDRRYGFMFQSFYLRDNLDAILGRLLRLPVDGQPVTVLDISGVPSEVVNVVVSLLCRLIFEFALWSEREHSPPILLVCEEAHRYVPADGAPTFEPTRRAIDRIAKEGRKYGVSLCLVSQRPVRALGQQPRPVRHDHGAADEQRARPAVRPQRAAGRLRLADRRPAGPRHRARPWWSARASRCRCRSSSAALAERRSSRRARRPPSAAPGRRKSADRGFVDRTISRWRLQQR